MKFNKARTPARQMSYRVELSEYDAEPPVRAWLIDEFPEKLNPELEAMALYLTFGPWCGGEFVVPRKMGPNTASAIATDSVTDMFCAPVEFYPKPLPEGKNRLLVTTDLRKSAANSLISLPGSSWNGGMRSTNSVIMSSNTDVFQRHAGDIGPLVGLGLLFADALDADCLTLDVNEEVDPKTIERIRTLLGAVRIGFECITV